jgi:hypothetical protein
MEKPCLNVEHEDRDIGQARPVRHGDSPLQEQRTARTRNGTNVTLTTKDKLESLSVI